MPDDLAAQPWDLFVQPDQRTCGPTALVVARMLGDPAYAAYVEGGGDLTHARTVAGDARLKDRFRAETLAMHARVTGLADISGHAQIPWPKAFGTPPWAVARQLSATPAADGSVAPYSWHVARTDLTAGFERLLEAGDAHRVSSIFIGSTWVPRHVVLVVDRTAAGTVRVFDPAHGRLIELARPAFTGRKVGIAGWDVPWFVVTPDA
jgi:hypothetical protein